MSKARSRNKVRSGLTRSALSDLVADVHGVLSGWNVKETDTDIWFRGVDRASRPLLPKVYRSEFVNADQNSLLYRFQAHANALVTVPLDAWGWYFLGQHHGLPTRLLDWTENLFAAAFFALAPYFQAARMDQIVDNTVPRQAKRLLRKADPPAVWVLDATQLNRTMVHQDAILVPGGKRLELWRPEGVERNRLRRIKLKGRNLSNEGVVAILPTRSNHRIVAQQGMFTLHGSSARPLEQRYGAGPTDRLAKLNIDSTRAAAIWRDLHLCGVNTFSVFPDLDHLAQYVMLNLC